MATQEPDEESRTWKDLWRAKVPHWYLSLRFQAFLSGRSEEVKGALNDAIQQGKVDAAGPGATTYLAPASESQ